MHQIRLHSRAFSRGNKATATRTETYQRICIASELVRTLTCGVVLTFFENRGITMTNADDPSLNPFAATTTPEAANPVALQRSYGGIGRLAYVGLTVLVNIVFNVVLLLLVAEDTVLFMPVVLVDFGANLWIIAQRITNTGYSRWWCVAIAVPFLNILLAVSLIACPEGFADHRTLDTAAKIIVGLFLVMFALVVIVFNLAAMS